MKVSFFVTCITDNVLPAIGIHSMQLLEKLGCTVFFNPKQTCCGQPLTNSGHPEKAKESMRILIDALLEDNCEYIVAPSGSCVLQVKEFPRFFKTDDAWRSKATLLANKSYEITDFIVNILKVTDVGAVLNGRAAYHPSCHMSRMLGVKDPPYQLLKNVKGLELIPFKGQDKCCV